MTVVTTYPDSTVANTGTLQTAGTIDTAHEILADSSDGTYVLLQPPSQLVWVTTANPTIPAGAVVTKERAYIRAYGIGGPPRLRTTMAASTDDSESLQNVKDTILSNTTVKLIQVNTLSDYNIDETSVAWVGLHNSAYGYALITQMRLDTVYVAKPTLSVTSPSGTVTTDSTPTVTWAGTLDADGSSQFLYETRVVASTVYGGGGDPGTMTAVWSSSALSGSTSIPVGTPLSNATYRAYVRIGVLPNGFDNPVLYSDWAYSQFVENVAIPGTPTITPTAENSSGRVKLVLAGTGGGTTTTGFDVERLGTDGSYTPVRTVAPAEGRVVGTAGTIYDYEPTNGTANVWRARAYHAYADSNESYSAYGSGTLTPAATGWWLKHPFDSSKNREVTVRSFATQERPARQSVVQPLGRDDPVVVSDTRAGEQGEIVFRMDTATARDDLKSLADAQVPLLLVPQAGHYEPNRWVRLGDEAITRLIDAGGFPVREASYGFTVVARPDGTAVA